MRRISRAQTAKKLGTVLPAHVAEVDQAQIHFIDQGGRLQDVVGLLSRHVTMRRPVQLLIHQGCQLLQGARIPLAPSPEQLGYLVR